MAHRFRFFVDGECTVGDRADLAPADVQHLRVIRAGDGEPVDVVDATGQVFAGFVVGGRHVELERLIDTLRDDLPDIVLYAGALPGQRWDALVDAAVQAGVAAIVPVVQSTREQGLVERRAPRVLRLAEAAAKQAKRLRLPRLEQPMRLRDLPVGMRGIVLDERSDLQLVEVDAWACTMAPADDVVGSSPAGTLALLVGPAAGLPEETADALQDGGWVGASLGPTVFRSELAAGVAVSCAMQLLQAGRRVG